MKLTKSKLKEIIREEIQKLNEAKYPFEDVKVGTKIHYDYGIVYVVTKLYPGGLQMSMKSRDKTTGAASMFQQKAELEQDNYESQVRVGLIKKVK